MAAPTLEPHSLALACALSSLFVALVMLSIRNPWVRTRGAPWFAASALAACASFLLVAFPPPLDGSALLMLRGANTILLFGLMVAGICRFVGRRVPWLSLVLSTLLMALVIALYPLTRQDVGPRVFAFSALVVAWTLAGIALLLRHRLPGQPALGRVCACLGLLALATCASLRAFVLLGHGPVSGDQALHAPINAWLLLAGFAALLLTLSGLAMLQNERLIHELAHWGSHDPLTGALSRKGFNDAWPRWLQTQGPGHLVLIDLEHRAAADEGTLQLLAGLLKRLLPDGHLWARQSGSSFLLALPERLLGPREWCDQLQLEFAQQIALHWMGPGMAPQLSLGLAAMQHSLAETARRANVAMQDRHARSA